MTLRPVHLLLTLGAVALSCTGPTEVCGCSIPYSAVVVAGVLTTTSDVPVAGARVLVDGVPPTMSSEPPISGGVPAVTGADGAFRTTAYSRYGTGTLALRARVIRAGTTDTVRLRPGSATFRMENATLDSVRVMLRIP